MSARSFLSVPANRPDRFAKAFASGADAIIVDLEDSVAPRDKESACESLAAHLTDVPPGVQLIVRVNAAGTAWCARDVETCAALDAVSAIILPKVESAADVGFAERLSRGARTRSERKHPLGVYALIESAGGVANAKEIAAGELRGLILGYADLAASMGREVSSGWRYAQEAVLTAARVHALEAIDGPSLSVELSDGFRESVQCAVDLGFDGKWVIHPAQVAAVNEAFQPSADHV